MCESGELEGYVSRMTPCAQQNCLKLVYIYEHCMVADVFICIFLA